MIDISVLNLDKSVKILIVGGDQIDMIENLIQSVMDYYEGDDSKKLDYALNYNIWIWEKSKSIFDKLIKHIDGKWGLPKTYNINNFDFLVADIRVEFDYVLGDLEDSDLSSHEWYKDFHKLFGRRMNQKVHPNRYSYTIIKSIELLTSWGQCIFMVSRSLRLSRQMKGLRKVLLGTTKIEITEIGDRDLIHLIKTNSDKVIINGIPILVDQIEFLPAEKWILTDDFSQLFQGKTLANFGITFPGIEIGRKDFIKKIDGDGVIENFKWEFQEVQEFNKRGDIEFKKIPIRWDIQEVKIPLLSGTYRPINSHVNNYLWSSRTTALMWRNDLEEVISPEENWGLRFSEKNIGRSGGLTWNLKLEGGEIYPRFIVGECFSDNTSPIFILSWDVDFNELFFILAWLISSKMRHFICLTFGDRTLSDHDFLKLPYPSWVDDDMKLFVVELVQLNITNIMMGLDCDIDELRSKLDEIF